MSIPTTAVTGRHRILFTYVNKRKNFDLSREFTFNVVNDGTWNDTTVRDRMKARHGQVAVLQHGMPSGIAGVGAYGGASDTYMHATHKVGDRNTDFVNYGTTENLAVGNYGQEKRALIRFDLSKLPKKAVVGEAALQMYLYGWAGRGNGSATFEVYEVLKPWAEGRGNGSRWVKQPVLPNEASWKCGRHPARWSKPGCGGPGEDRSASPMSTASVNRKIKLWVTFKLDPKLVNRWIADPAKNHGVLLAVMKGGRHADFRSSNFEDAGMRPRLVLGFKSGVKVAAVAGAAGAAGAGGSVARKSVSKPAAKPEPKVDDTFTVPDGYGVIHLKSGKKIIGKNIVPCAKGVCYVTPDGKDASVSFSAVKRIERPK